MRIMSHLICLTATLCLIPSAFSQTEGAWRFCNGPEFPGAQGSLESSPAGITLAYDFQQGGNYVAAYQDFSEPIFLGGISFTLRKTPDVTITARVADSSGQTFQKSVYYNSDQPQALQMTMNDWTGHFGGANDGILRQPILRIGILVENRNLETPTGLAIIESLELARISKEEAEQVQAASNNLARSYIATDFGPDCILANSARDLLKDRLWRLDFSRQETYSLGGSLSLFHRPVSLTIRLKSSEPGAMLSLNMGAHFQGFKRTLGTLNGKEQEFTVTMPPDQWESYGAPHKELHYPLRITGLSVSRHECKTDSISITLRDISCNTNIEGMQTTILKTALQVTHANALSREFLLTCYGWNLNSAPTSGMLALVARNWDGADLHSTSMPITLPENGKRSTVSYRFSVPAQWRYVDVACSFNSQDAPAAQAMSTFTAAMDDNGSTELLPAPVPGLTPESPWGMGVYLYRYPFNEQGLADMEYAASLAAAAGVKWTREEFNIGMIEKAPGEYDFSFFDALVGAAHRHGISVYGLLSYWSPFAEPYTEAGIQAYCNYARAAVRHFKGRVQHWEVYNEPNIFFWDGPKELYSELLKRVYVIIKEENPDAEVLAISTAGIDRQFIRMVVQSEAPFDALTVHPYRSQFIERAFIRELTHASVLAHNRPVWITEMGWSTQVGEGGKTEREQAQLLARCYLSAVGAGVRNMGWYDFRNDGTDPFYNEVNFGVLHQDFIPKAAYRALACVCRTLAHTSGQPLAWLKHGNGAKGWYGVTNGANNAVWTPDQDVVMLLESDNAALSAHNLMGESQPFSQNRTLPALPVPPRGCRSQADVSAAALPRTEYEITLRKGDPLFITGGPIAVTHIEPVSAATDAAEPIIF